MALANVPWKTTLLVFLHRFLVALDVGLSVHDIPQTCTSSPYWFNTKSFVGEARPYQAFWFRIKKHCSYILCHVTHLYVAVFWNPIQTESQQELQVLVVHRHAHIITTTRWSLPLAASCNNINASYYLVKQVR